LSIVCFLFIFYKKTHKLHAFVVRVTYANHTPIRFPDDSNQCGNDNINIPVERLLAASLTLALQNERLGFIKPAMSGGKPPLYNVHQHSNTIFR
jgi:hypothetical protein